LKPSKIIIYIDTCNGSRLTFTNMLWQIATITRATLCALSVRARSPARACACRREYVPPLQEGDADELLLSRKTQQAAFIRISGQINHRSNRESFSGLFPIALTHYVRKQSELSQASACLNTFFWKYIEQFV